MSGLKPSIGGNKNLVKNSFFYALWAAVDRHAEKLIGKVMSIGDGKTTDVRGTGGIDVEEAQVLELDLAEDV